MAYQYAVNTDKGAFDVTVQQHHDHISRVDFERALLGALVSEGVRLIVNFSLKGRR